MFILLIDDLDRYNELMNLSDRNEKLFYRVIAEKLMPIVHTPTVGLACQKYGLVFRRPRGLFITIHDKGHIYDILCNWTEQQVKAIVVTDGERILGLGDLGAFGMGIPVGKLQLYTAIAGISPRHCLPIMLDVGTNNQISSNPLYIGLRQKRVIGKEYDEFINEFMQAVVQRFGWHCLIQFEDFASHNAHKLLEKYQKKYCTFNDDIQGTAAVVLAGLFAALRITGKKLIDNTYLFVGAGQAACGIADLITHAMIREGSSIEEARSKIWMYDIHGLIVRNRPQGNIEGPKASYLKKGRAIKDLSSVIDYVKPTVLMGASGVARLFHDGVLKKMAQVNDRPIIFALSNPISRAECTAEEAYRETDKLGSLVTQKDLDSGRIYPPIPTIREVTIKIAAHLVEHLYKEKKAWFHPEPKDKEEFIRMQLYNTNYQYFGPLTWKWPELHKKPRNVPSMDDNIVLES
ncbi:unnamed protein product [Rotaria sp. Silwood2]|nr:unnamed protein product [Rotaria sp. Silwood2]CAF4101393.1 unnamed protein product [Rotaria sp. Silwood2]